MLNEIDGYWMSVLAPFFFDQQFTIDPLPPGTNAYATIALSDVNTVFEANGPDPKFAATAFVSSYTFYNPDGTESDPQIVGDGADFTQNAIGVQNCARITFNLVGEGVFAIAQINIFRF